MAKLSFVPPDAKVLRNKCKPVKITKEIKTNIGAVTKVLETLPEQAVAIAAPQLGIPMRFFVYKRGDGEIRAVINPKVVWTSIDDPNEVVLSDITGAVPSKEVLPEECLSLPGEEYVVRRPFAIKVEYETEKGVQKKEFLTGGAARIFLHEMDHLDGVLISDLATEMESPIVLDEDGLTDEQLVGMLSKSMKPKYYA